MLEDQFHQVANRAKGVLFQDSREESMQEGRGDLVEAPKDRRRLDRKGL